MSTLVQFFVACLLVLVALASAQECDESSFTKVRACIYKSAVYNNLLFPRNVSDVNHFCMKGMDTSYNCVRDIRNPCVNNTKVNKLMDLTVNLGTFLKGLQSFCSQKSVDLITNNAQCLTDSFGTTEYTTCVNNAIGQEINAGDVTDLKKILDTDCDFFAAFSKCQLDNFKDECKSLGTIYGSLIESGSYPYCKKSLVERELAIQDYNMTSSANILASSLALLVTIALLRL